MDVRRIIIFIFLMCGASVFAGELYKYKDENGKWAYTDKKPNARQDYDKVEYKGDKKGPPKPRVYTKKIGGQNALVFHNPYYAPVEVEIISSIYSSGRHKEVIAANTRKTLYKSKHKIPKYNYRLGLGDPDARADRYLYTFPVSSKAAHNITQSFNGRFSHTREPNVFSVDIAVPVGTYISAARAGRVIWTKDDYHMGGANNYFLDKANYVYVLHDDGTYAVYAHLLQGSLLVDPGDKVDVGDRLARSGSSGFSTGPHLHFVIRKNTGLNSASVPFKFIDNAGNAFVPRRGMKVEGIERGTL